ncbi:MAG: chromate transporter [Firmicutes bacterium HGW-Firmicutes-21]|nr:MAG: chromate transporter [Firmicutes bacterium HGW-Firmicutes-21]
MIYLEIFWSFFQIGLFSIGGGLVTLPLIQNQVVNLHGWLTLDEFADVVTVSEMTPGPIAINAATFVGARVGGAAGAVIATFGFIFPSLIITSVIAYLYLKYNKFGYLKAILSGLRPAVVGLIASAGLSILILAFFRGGGFPSDLSDINFFAVILFAVCLFILRKYKAHPILVLAVAGAAGGVFYSVFGLG